MFMVYNLLPFIGLDFLLIALCFVFVDKCKKEKLFFWKIALVINILLIIILILPQLMFIKITFF